MFSSSNLHGDDREDYALYRNRQISAGYSNEIKFELPPRGIRPKDFVEAHFGKKSDVKGMKFYKGTTTLAFVYEPATPDDKGGVVVAVDSRATGGEFIASKTVMKIIKINDHMVATMAGGAADCQFWVRVVAKYCNLFELREKMPISVSSASKYFANVLYSYRDSGLQVGSMVAGVDKSGPSIFWVDNDGYRQKMPRVCSIGSGSLSAFGILDTYYKPKMTDAEAIELGKRAIMHASFRDIGSGGYCSVAHITQADGSKMYGPYDLSELYHNFAEASGQELGPKALSEE